MNIELKLKVYKATMWHYQQLYQKEFAEGGISHNEFDELIDVFVDAMWQAEELMRSYHETYPDSSPMEIDETIDSLAGLHLLRYTKKWKLLYSGLYHRILENRMVANDRRNLFDAYEVLSSLDTSSMIWQIKIGQMTEFLYYEFSNSHRCVSLEQVTPKELKYDKDRDVLFLVAEDACQVLQNYLIDLILSVDPQIIHEYKEDKNHGKEQY